MTLLQNYCRNFRVNLKLNSSLLLQAPQKIWEQLETFEGNSTQSQPGQLEASEAELSFIRHGVATERPAGGSESDSEMLVASSSSSSS